MWTILWSILEFKKEEEKVATFLFEVGQLSIVKIPSADIRVLIDILECRKYYPTGIVCREMNSNGVYEYFTR